ncbi:facilitated trehalose transporter Tret1-like [Zerene cesonia]|uniref:facilitated trehalose transporter Tret1-like n=1 Tax=Zerene cesonia TaxID=33412 RepID=UPI0018E55B1D|nr:facilitated trehalose transporter Tret1-like [Zerene cesonia]
MCYKKSRSPFLKQCFVTAAICFNIMGQGAAFGYPAVLLPALKSDESPIPLSKLEESWVAGMLPLAMILGFLLTPPLMDKLGRRATHIILTVPALAGWFLVVLASNVTVIIIARTLQGVSVGILTSLRSALIGEYTSPKNRGAFLTTVSLSQAFGIFFVHLVGSVLSWQQTALVCVFLPYISLLMIMYTPESPSWLITQGRFDECRKVFHWLRGEEEDDELEAMIQARIAFEKFKTGTTQNKNRFTALFETIRKKEFYKPTILMFHANVIQQFSGGPTMAAFSTVIISNLMGPKADIAFWMVFLDTQRITCNLIAVYIINNVKRRTMMFSTVGLCIVSHVAISMYVLCRLNGWSYDAIWLPALLINLQYLSVAIGTVPLPNIIAGEVFPLEHRSVCGTISLTSGGVFTFLVLKTFPELMDRVGLQGTYLLYAVIMSLNLIVVWVLLPETKGKTLQEIEDELRGKPLKYDEIEARLSIQTDPVETYKRRVSEGRCSSTPTI